MPKLAGQLLILCEAIRFSMREKLIKAINSSRAITYGSLVLLTFIVAMKQPLKDRLSPTNKPYTYLALGDSYTMGEKVQPGESFPSQVTSILNEKGYAFEKPRIVAQTGWTTDELQAAINNSKLNTPYDFVTLLIGVNNQYRGRKATDYKFQFEALLKQALQFANNDSSHVIILSIPDWGATPFADGRDRKQIATEINEYNSANKLLAGKYKVPYINITGGTREAAKDLSLLTSDGLHPSGKEYSRWAKEVADLIQKKL
jgi:lysophospholipase L1-like esterase